MKPSACPVLRPCLRSGVSGGAFLAPSAMLAAALSNVGGYCLRHPQRPLLTLCASPVTHPTAKPSHFTTSRRMTENLGSHLRAHPAVSALVNGSYADTPPVCWLSLTRGSFSCITSDMPISIIGKQGPRVGAVPADNQPYRK